MTFQCSWCKTKVKSEYPEELEFTLKVERTVEYTNLSWGERETWDVDLCVDCTEKLKKFFISNNVEINLEEWEWENTYLEEGEY